MDFQSKDNLTPEEKLLRLIRKDKKKNSGGLNSGAKLKEGPVAFESSLLTEETDKAIENPFLFSFVKSFNFSLINSFITLAVIVGSAIFIFNLFYEPPNLRAKTQHTISKEKKELIKERKIPSFDYYQQAVSKRVLFRGGSKETSKEVHVIPKSKTFSQLMQNLNLIGIMTGDNLQAIIENKKEKETYFINIGDYLGEIRVLNIEPKKVTLEYQGETASLFL